jgi:hypothetical protein
MKALKRFSLVWMIAFIAALVNLSDAKFIKNPTVVLIGFMITAVLYAFADAFDELIGGE